MPSIYAEVHSSDSSKKLRERSRLQAITLLYYSKKRLNKRVRTNDFQQMVKIL